MNMLFFILFVSFFQFVLLYNDFPLVPVVPAVLAGKKCLACITYRTSRPLGDEVCFPICPEKSVDITLLFKFIHDSRGCRSFSRFSLLSALDGKPRELSKTGFEIRLVII